MGSHFVGESSIEPTVGPSNLVTLNVLAVASIVRIDPVLTFDRVESDWEYRKALLIAKDTPGAHDGRRLTRCACACGG